MPRFIIERNFAEQLELTPEMASEMTRVNADMGVQWLFSFLSADKKKTYCLFEASDAQVLVENAKRLGLPADSIVEVSDVKPEMFV